MSTLSAQLRQPAVFNFRSTDESIAQVKIMLPCLRVGPFRARKMPTRATPRIGLRHRQLLMVVLMKIVGCAQRGHPAHAMCKRLRRHEDEPFHFVRQQNVAATNNLAERVIHPLVTAPKISGGSRSPAGTQSRMVLHSLFTTWTAIGYSTLEACLALICGHPSALQL